ncbi:MAG: hypothetical protein GY855_00410 [candidate division Zixibacteria bacterium]|nr:hypothetical protein [candidate division Zixibacteria bacterium]
MTIMLEKINIACILTLLLLIHCEHPEKYTTLPEEKAQYSGIEISLPGQSLYVGDQVSASLLILLPSGEKNIAENSAVSWVSTDSTIIEIDDNGNITANSEGSASILASWEDLIASTYISVGLYSKLLINEIFYDPEGSESKDNSREFIEIYNDNDYCSDLSGFVLADGNGEDYSYFPEGSLISPKGFIVLVYSFKGFHEEFGNSFDICNLSFSLNNSGETTTLIRPDGSEDRVYIEGGSSDYPVDEDTWGSEELPEAEEGYSIQRTSFVDTDTCDDWTSGEPAPGR